MRQSEKCTLLICGLKMSYFHWNDHILDNNKVEYREWWAILKKKETLNSFMEEKCWDERKKIGHILLELCSFLLEVFSKFLKKFVPKKSRLPCLKSCGRPCQQLFAKNRRKRRDITPARESTITLGNNYFRAEDRFYLVIFSVGRLAGGDGSSHQRVSSLTPKIWK